MLQQNACVVLAQRVGPDAASVQACIPIHHKRTYADCVVGRNLPSIEHMSATARPVIACPRNENTNAEEPCELSDRKPATVLP